MVLIFELIPKSGPVREESLGFLDIYGPVIDDDNDEVRGDILWMLTMIACVQGFGLWQKRVGNKIL